MTASERVTASARIADQTIAMLLAQVPVGGIVAAYAAKASEVDTAQIDAALRATGRLIAYPRITGGGRQLAFHVVAIDELVPGKFSIREPLVTSPSIALGSILAFVIPCVAFSGAGSASMTRIGWGGGHYDSTLVAASASALRIGLAFDCQYVDGVPAEAHDIPLHHVVTETRVYPERRPHQG